MAQSRSLEQATDQTLVSLSPYPGYANEAIGYAIGGSRHPGPMQDAIWPSNLPGQSSSVDPGLLKRLGRLYIVADGVTHCADGVEASQLAVRTIAETYYSSSYPDLPDNDEQRQRLEHAFTTAHRRLQEWKGDLYCPYYFKHDDNRTRYWPQFDAVWRNQTPRCPLCGEPLRGLLTTAVAVVMGPVGLLMAAVGDSSAFRLPPQPGQSAESLYGATGDGEFLGSPTLDPTRFIQIRRCNTYSGDRVVLGSDGFVHTLIGRYTVEWTDQLRSLTNSDAGGRLARTLKSWGQQQGDAAYEDDQSLVMLIVAPESAAAIAPSLAMSANEPEPTRPTQEHVSSRDDALAALKSTVSLGDPKAEAILHEYNPTWAAAYRAAAVLDHVAGQPNVNQAEFARQLEFLLSGEDLCFASPEFRSRVADFIPDLRRSVSLVRKPVPEIEEALSRLEQLVGTAPISSQSPGSYESRQDMSIRSRRRVLLSDGEPTQPQRLSYKLVQENRMRQRYGLWLAGGLLLLLVILGLFKGLSGLVRYLPETNRPPTLEGMSSQEHVDLSVPATRPEALPTTLVHSTLPAESSPVPTSTPPPPTRAAEYRSWPLPLDGAPPPPVDGLSAPYSYVLIGWLERSGNDWNFNSGQYTLRLDMNAVNESTNETLPSLSNQRQLLWMLAASTDLDQALSECQATQGCTLRSNLDERDQLPVVEPRVLLRWNLKTGGPASVSPLVNDQSIDSRSLSENWIFTRMSDVLPVIREQAQNHLDDQPGEYLLIQATWLEEKGWLEPIGDRYYVLHRNDSTTYHVSEWPTREALPQ